MVLVLSSVDLPIRDTRTLTRRHAYTYTRSREQDAVCSCVPRFRVVRRERWTRVHTPPCHGRVRVTGTTTIHPTCHMHSSHWRTRALHLPVHSVRPFPASESPWCPAVHKANARCLLPVQTHDTRFLWPPRIPFRRLEFWSVPASSGMRRCPTGPTVDA